MNVLPRHVVCVLGQWRDFSAVTATISKCPYEFTLDRDYSQLKPDERMTIAFEASMDRFHPTLTDLDWEAIRRHTAVAYILSPPMHARDAERISTHTLLLTAALLRQGGVAAKSESAGLAHGHAYWIDLARKYMANRDSNPFSARSALYWAWVQRIIHDSASGSYYSCGMHLLGHPDTDVDDALDPSVALEWIDLMGLYLVADRPERPLKDGEGFRLAEDGPRRIIRKVACSRYDEDEFLFNPYGYHRLTPDGDELP